MDAPLPFTHRIAGYAIALLAVAAVTVATAWFAADLGPAASALLFLLPVLLVAARGGRGPSLTAAAASALAYNFFLLPPRYTLRVHGFDNVVSLIVLFSVAIVTSRLADRLKARITDARAQAEASAQAAEFAALLADKTDPAMLDVEALAFLTARLGAARLMTRGDISGETSALSALDHGAAAWAADNGETTGHATAIMAAADWTFVPLHRSSGSDVLAISRPEGGVVRDCAQVDGIETLAGLLGRARDRLALEQERQARRRLEERDSLRRTLFASLAHDFRTPLTVIRAGVEALALREGESGRAPLLAEIFRLERMLADLLGLARLEADAVEPRFEPVDLVDVITDVVERGHVVPAGFALTIALPDDLPLVDADPALLRQMLLNLVDNAARHGGACIAIHAEPANNDRVALSICDDGPGIPAGEEEAIFERFTRIDIGDRTGGSGLGLAIVAGFAHAMNIAIETGTGPSGGARFTLQIAVFRGKAVA